MFKILTFVCFVVFSVYASVNTSKEYEDCHQGCKQVYRAKSLRCTLSDYDVDNCVANAHEDYNQCMNVCQDLLDVDPAERTHKENPSDQGVEGDAEAEELEEETTECH
jgi:hypothetical protein